MLQLGTHKLTYDVLWFDAFIKTQIIEISLGLIVCIGYVFWSSPRIPAPYSSLTLAIKELKTFYTHLKFIYMVLVFLTATCITHPFLWFILPKYIQVWELSYHSYVLIGELIVWLVEALWYYLVIEVIQKRYVLALALSFLLNSTSYLIGIYL